MNQAQEHRVSMPSRRNAAQSSWLPSRFRSGVLMGIVAAMVATPATAQIGSTICACSPSFIEFTLDFSLGCDNSTVMGPGVIDKTCSIAANNADETASSLIPVEVFAVDISEIDQEGTVSDRQFDFVFLENESTFTYSTFISNPDAITEETATKTLMLTLLGTNLFDQDLRMEWSITYTNACDIFPVLSSGEQIGWTRFVSSSV